MRSDRRWRQRILPMTMLVANTLQGRSSCLKVVTILLGTGSHAFQRPKVQHHRQTLHHHPKQHSATPSTPPCRVLTTLSKPIPTLLPTSNPTSNLISSHTPVHPRRERKPLSSTAKNELEVGRMRRIRRCLRWYSRSRPK
jgi:hypothetical protein